MSGSGPSKHLRMLKRRADWLQERVANAVYDTSYDKSEIEALTWAIEHLQHLRGPVIAHRAEEKA